MSKTSTMGEVEDLDQFEVQNPNFGRIADLTLKGGFAIQTRFTSTSQPFGFNHRPQPQLVQPPVMHCSHITRDTRTKSHTMFRCADARPVHTARRLHTTTHYARGFHSITFYRVLHCRCGTTMGRHLDLSIFGTCTLWAILAVYLEFCNMSLTVKDNLAC